MEEGSTIVTQVAVAASNSVFHHGFSLAEILTFWLDLLWRAVWGIGGSLAAAVASTHWIWVAPTKLWQLETFPDIAMCPLGGKNIPIENHCSVF